jgi:hypothetical protein
MNESRSYVHRHVPCLWLCKTQCNLPLPFCNVQFQGSLICNVSVKLAPREIFLRLVFKSTASWRNLKRCFYCVRVERFVMVTGMII